MNCPPKIKEMISFENDITNLLKTIKFRETKSSFQQQLTEDIKIIKNTKTTLTFADKTSNAYKVLKEQYEKLVNNAIRTSYKKISNKAFKDKELIKRIFVNDKQNCFITIKDH